MSTILTDDERPELPMPRVIRGTNPNVYSDLDMEAYADAREAAVLAKLEQQEPVAWLARRPNGDSCAFEAGDPDLELARTDPTAIFQPLYTRPAPQQADRQQVPEDWKMVQAALRFYADASDYKAPFTGGMGKLWFDCGTVARSALDRIDAMLAAAPEAPAQAVSEREAFPVNLTVEHIDRFEAAISDLGPATVQAAAWVCELARAALTKQPAAQAIAADDLHTEAIAEGFESVADYVAYLKKSKDTYFAERNNARDAARRNREAPAQASAVDERAAPEVTEFNVGRWCLSEDDCIEQGIDFAAYERGVADSATAFGRNRARVANGIGGEGKR